MYSVKKIFDSNQLEQLILLSEALTPAFALQDYNIYNAEKTNINNKLLNSSLFDPLRSFSGMKIFVGYFLKYYPTGFTAFHKDQISNVDMTIVTMLDSKTLRGGETILMMPYQESTTNVGYIKKHTNIDMRGKNIVPKVVRCEDGDSLIYGKNLTHGVGEVSLGTRLVLVTWLSKR